MTISDTAKNISAIAGVVILAFGAVNYFQTKADAAEQKQEVQKSVEQLRAELLLARIKELNAKKERTPDEQLELELNLAQVKAIQAAQVKK